ncbi:MAG: peptidase M16 [Chitinophagales bacterium]|nr:MAG: peptidase M16 [Chitinophagales bacterium]
MKTKTALLWAALILIIAGALACKPKQKAERYDYETVAGDPLQARIYTLKNGLKVYLSVNPREPRIQTYIAVRAGSKSDPQETTGLAHYLEHMLFKGTHKFGTINWEAEKVLLDSISALYEQHLAAKDPATKKAIYRHIDSLSYEASKYAVPNEYDKMISSLGAKGTNAYTWVEQTVYVNDIPSNELEKWLMVESDRFRTLVLRLFHTELETVYEEFNRAQDNDGRKSWNALMKGLFPSHPYGTQTTLGEGEHLKNPSMVNIHKYFEKYYVPNNMAICMSGDLDPDKTVALIEKYFGDWEPRPVEPFSFEPQPNLTEPVIKESFGPQKEHVYVGFRSGGAATREALMIKLIAEILYNGKAGLIDLNLNQKQKALAARAFDNIMADYGMLVLYGEPRAGQTLEEVKDLLLQQMDSLKQGAFEDWLLDAVIKNRKLQQLRAYESNRSRAHEFVDAFILGLDWKDVVNELAEMDKITKEEIVAFARQHFNNNYVVSYKRLGTDPLVYKVEKPLITPVVMNRDTQSAFKQHFDTLKSERLVPVFADFQKEIQTSTLSADIPFYYVHNDFNDLFELYLIFDMGTDNDKKMGIAVKYLPYLGTSRFTAEELKKELFKKGLSLDVNASRDQVYVALKGLGESFTEGVQLLAHVLSDVQPDSQALADIVDGIFKEREDARRNKGVILNTAMVSYAKYGPRSSFTHILSAEELKALDPAELTNILHSLTGYKHRVFYYGKNTPEAIKSVLKKNLPVAETLQEYPPPAHFPELEINENKVFCTNYDMVQAEMLLLSKGPLYDKTLAPFAALFNEYFGGGLSSIVFQEIREQKALAYAAYAYFSTPRWKEESHYVVAYLGTQADKLPLAVEAMKDLLSEMPRVAQQFEASREAAMKIIESERIVGPGLFWSYEAARKRGLEYDIRKDIYENLKTVTLDDLDSFFNKHIKDKNYTCLVVGKISGLDKKALEKLGPVRELTLEEIFNY